MNKAFNKQVDQMIIDVNNISKEQLKLFDIDYLKCLRWRKYLFILSTFSSIFLARMGEIYEELYKLEFPNKLFRCYVVIVIDLETNRFHTNRIYTFPILFDLSRTQNITSKYKDIYEQVDKDMLKLNFDLEYSFSSRTFSSRRPLTSWDNTSYTIKGKQEVEFNFEIEHFVKNYVSINGASYVMIDDPYYIKQKITREKLIGDTDCTCVDEKSLLRYACKGCSTDRSDCSGYHVKRCLCGKFTYQRSNMCLKCHLTYTRSKIIKSVFDKGNLNTSHSLISFIPFLHYNQGTNGFCLGNGSAVINDLITNNINPVRLILAFQTNLAYTDSEHTRSYYLQKKHKVTNRDFKNYGEYIPYLNAIFHSNGHKIRDHIFSLYCYCIYCLFFKIVLFSKDKKLHNKSFQSRNTFVTSRDMFIKLYKKYLNISKSGSIYGTYIHKIVKQVVNTKPKDFLIVE